MSKTLHSNCSSKSLWIRASAKWLTIPESTIPTRVRPRLIEEEFLSPFQRQRSQWRQSWCPAPWCRYHWPRPHRGPHWWALQKHRQSVMLQHCWQYTRATNTHEILLTKAPPKRRLNLQHKVSLWIRQSQILAELPLCIREWKTPLSSLKCRL